MAVILSSLRDGGELSLMNGDNNLGGINLPQFWLLFFCEVNTYRVASWSDDNNNRNATSHSLWQPHLKPLAHKEEKQKPEKENGPVIPKEIVCNLES